MRQEILSDHHDRLSQQISLVVDAFSQANFAALLFAPDNKLTLLWRNKAHEVMSASEGRDVVGMGMFEAFPPSEDAEDGGAAKQAIYDTVAQIMETGTATEIGPYRYDLTTENGDYAEYHWIIRTSPVMRDGKVVACLQVAEDVTRQELDRHLSDALRRMAKVTAAISQFSYDPASGRLERSAAVDEMFGFEPGEAGDKAAPFLERIHPEDLPFFHAEVDRVFAAPRGTMASLDYRVPQKDGTTRYLRVRAEVVTDPEDRREKLVGSLVDLTDVEMDRQALARELSLREALIDEANHRIKNSLAIAMAMLRSEKSALRKSGGEVEDALASLSALEARIGAISSTHGLMQLSGDRIDVSLQSLLSEIVATLRQTADLPEEDICLTVTGEERHIPSDKASGLGLIMNELLTNALKYGLHEEGGADISVTLHTKADAAEIIVRNKIERAQPIATISSSKLGSMLVAQLATDFGATVEADPGETHYQVRVTLPI
ncbi:PAS domain-containing protein [Cognatishimia sp. SS12]|uniref:sensor histidine kinase n=1 Tax=Cognatishimia sp. SS12 TaxID=2979465 RepID=UPI002330D940|nr:PAS domain-containing protein [Cognatishimia sp. SS12]MDC0739095.1 PAS domain-containing protein [Cognatishimia sp. SS12]